MSRGIGPVGRVGLVLIVLLAGCTGNQVGSPSSAPVDAANASVSPSIAGGLPAQGLSRDRAIEIARTIAGVDASTPAATAVAGPFSRFEPVPNAKVPQPSPDHWVWWVTFATSPTSTSTVMIDYYTGAFIETGIAVP